jgi:putative colanic acid biosysnthesis UDP-glucose lipid carrier transferase
MKSRPTSALRSSIPLSARPSARARARNVPRQQALALVITRLLDVLFAGSALLILALPMAVIALIVKLSSRGPAFYSQERIGRGGRPFVIYKFRTMVADAEAATGPVWAKRGDPRCTVVGHALRRSCLDELPQLFNVLKGDMSLVGPRPERPCFVQEFSRHIPAYNQRHHVRPGITGWAQINGWRGDSSLEKRVEHDLFYVRHWSVWFNLRIMLLTPLRILVDQNGC